MHWCPGGASWLKIYPFRNEIPLFCINDFPGDNLLYYRIPYSEGGQSSHKTTVFSAVILPEKSRAFIRSQGFAKENGFFNRCPQPFTAMRMVIWFYPYSRCYAQSTMGRHIAFLVLVRHYPRTLRHFLPGKKTGTTP